MTQKYYIKADDGEFVLVGTFFAGWPTPGIWVVEDGHSSCVYQFTDVHEKPTPTLVSYMQYKNELADYISSEWNRVPLSCANIAAIACEFFAIKAGGIKVATEIIEN